MNLKKLLIPNLPYAVIGLYATKLSEAWRLTPGVDFSEKLLNTLNYDRGIFRACPAFTQRICASA